MNNEHQMQFSDGRPGDWCVICGTFTEWAAVKPCRSLAEGEAPEWDMREKQAAPTDGEEGAR